ncbi:MAG TPA: prolyl oligopeptidase family serine peptidase [Gemmatimonadota bacterium]|nr:prolyl oligopeptidase family serine peptidase [Gemmatimonadota bacterium]
MGADRRIPGLVLAVLLVLSAILATRAPAQEAPEEDPFLWLEDVEGERALAWVESQNASTLAELAKQAVYDSIYDESLAILNSQDKIDYPTILGDRIYNFWQDAEHERGIWRRASWESYLSGAPDWETVIDVDALAEEEEVPWAFHGATCHAPSYRRCLVRLSRGGADAVEVREFDLESSTFVEGGFHLPEAKSSVAWRGPDALIVTTDFGAGSLTEAGYPRVAKLWTRGTPLEAATVLFEGAVTDVGVWAGTVDTPEKSFAIIYHSPTFFESRVHVLEADGALRLIDVPLDAILDLTGRDLVVYLRSPWEIEGRSFAQGSVLAIDFERFLQGDRAFEVVVEPGPRTTVEGVRVARGELLVSVLDNVVGELWRYRRQGGEWIGEPVPAPGMGSVNVVAADPLSERYFFTFGTYTQPTTLYQGGPGGEVREVRRMPGMFDAEGLVIRQLEATSADGTRVPYFVVHREEIREDGENPTLLYGYGGFQISETPYYGSIRGKAWLERGGVFAAANIRGGGEFGPAWWKAAQKENRQRAFDDFLAVAQDLIDRGISSPRRLGIEGGSNGGLLVAAAMTQRPELFEAVVIEVPLLDMRRYHTLLAGASWMAEYGNPDIPAEWEYLRRYSPYHNVSAAAEYPRALFYTTTRDDRVHPGHARKMAARMLDLGHPVYYYENTEGGHGAGVTPEQRARMYAIVHTYLIDRLMGAEGERLE